jgi:hypothetical protein
MLLLLLALSPAVTSQACAMGRKNPKEPKIERCSHYDDGSARCLLADGVTLVTKMPSELDGYISTNPIDADRYDQFCHRSAPK